MAEIRNLTRNGETFYPLTHEKAVIGMEDFKDTITTQISQYQPIEITGDVTNAPDEEDITSDSNNLLKFKNRNNLYGLGKVILRRGSSFASQVTQANTIYVIQYNFDLDSARINIPNGSILLFEGGALSNGTLVCADLYDVRLVYYQDQSEILSSVTLEGNFIHKACDKDTIREILVDNSSITKDANDVLSVKSGGIQNSHLNSNIVDASSIILDSNNKVSIKTSGVQNTHLNSNTVDDSSISLDSNNKISIKDGGVTGAKLNSGIVNTDDLSVVNSKIQLANRGTSDGMGKIILRKDQSFASQLTQQNTIYVIRYNFTLTSDVTIPDNCILKFEGGSINGYIINGSFYVTGLFKGTTKVLGSMKKVASPFNPAPNNKLYQDLLESNVKDSISVNIGENEILYKIERQSRVQNLRVGNTNTKKGTCFSTEGTSNPHENLFEFINISGFAIGINFYSGGYTQINNCVFLSNLLGLLIGRDSGWVGAMSITQCRFYANKVGLKTQNNGSTYISDCVFEGNLHDLEIFGGATFENCYFGDHAIYSGDRSDGFRLAVVGPGASVTFTRCQLGLAVPDDFTTSNCFMFELQGTDANPCTVLIEDCVLTLANQYSASEWLYKSLSSKNKIIFKNVKLSISNNQQHTSHFPMLFDNISGVIGESNEGINYVIDGYFQDSIQNAQLAKKGNVTVLDTPNIYGGKTVKITPYSMFFFYKIPAKYIGVTMSLEINIVNEHNGNAPSIIYNTDADNYSDCEETGRGYLSAYHGKSAINRFDFTPTKEIGKIQLFVGVLGEQYPDPYMTIGYIKLVPKQFKDLADMLPSVNDIIYLPTTDMSASDITSYRDVYNANGKVERT